MRVIVIGLVIWIGLLANVGAGLTVVDWMVRRVRRRRVRQELAQVVAYRERERRAESTVQ